MSFLGAAAEKQHPITTQCFAMIVILIGKSTKMELSICYELKCYTKKVQTRLEGVILEYT
jgi:hypothetical protein